MKHFIKLTNAEDGKAIWVRKDKVCHIIGDQSNAGHNSILHMDNGEDVRVKEFASGLCDELEKC
jgi:hypothetical protein